MRPCATNNPIVDRALPGEAPIILVVEDEPVNQMLMSCALSRAGFRPLVADDGLHAVQLVEDAAKSNQPLAMALMDIQMPNCDGIEAARRIRSMGFGPDRLPIVAFTATYSDQRARDCLDAGMQDAVPKPLDIDALLDLLRRWSLSEAPLPGRGDQAFDMFASDRALCSHPSRKH